MKNFVVAICTVSLLLNACGDKEEALIKKADKMHEAILTVDTHCDTPMNLMRSDYDLGVRNDNGRVDFPRMKEGGLDAEFFAVFLGQGPRTEEDHLRVHNRALTIFDAIHANVEKNSDQAEIAYTADDAYRINAGGKSVAFIGMENGYPVGNDLSRLEEYYKRGARFQIIWQHQILNYRMAESCHRK